MDNEKLIEFVREYQFLYDLSNKGYSDNQKKDAAWRQIANKLQVDEKYCKKSWFLLRDAFRRAIKKKKQETKSGQASSSLKKWKYEDEMSFLLPYMKDRTTTIGTAGTATYKNIEGNLSDGNVEQQNSELNPNVSIRGRPSTSTRVLKRQRTIKQRKSKEMKLMKYILKDKKNLNDIEQFFTSIATTVQSFPIKDRALAKARVFEIISKMEIDILNRPSTSCSTPSTICFSNEINSCPQTPKPITKQQFL